MKYIKLFEEFVGEGVYDPGILKAFFRITPKNKCQKRRVFKPSSATWFLSKLITSVKRIKFGRVSSQEPRKQRPLRTLKCKRTSS